MKYVKLFEEFLNSRSIKAYHSSPYAITTLRNDKGMWFTDDLYYAKGYDKINPEQFTYEVEITGSILSRDELKKICQDNGEDYNEIETAFVTYWEEIVKEPMLQVLMKLGDGVRHWDYNPWNSQDSGIETICVFKPKDHVKIIRRLTAKELAV